MVAALALTWALARGAGPVAWPVLPLAVATALAGSLYWQARRR